MMRSPILVATDLWARSDRAVDRAFVLGEQLGRMVCVVHASKRGSKAQLSAEVLEAKVREVLPDPQAETKIFLPLGSPLQAIVDTAEMCDAELVVTAVARFNSFGDYMVGTAVDQIIRDGHRPVLVVKQRPHQPYRKLLVTTDFSDTSRRGLLVAASLFPQAEIHVLMAYHVAYEGLQKDAHLRAEAHQRREKEMAAFLADPEVAEALGGRGTPHLGYGDIGTVLLEQLDALDPDLVVAGTQGAGGLRRFAMGSVASSMLEWVECDMLVVPPEN